MNLNLSGRILAGLGLVALSPLLVFCALAIYIEDRGPILFRQTRIGINARPFVLFKLRSMASSSCGRRLTAGNDSRVTLTGKILREFKFDELPQLWNVVRGDMNFIGPRPEVSEYVDVSDPRWRAVLSFKPGITDVSSLYFRNEERLLAGREDLEDFYRRWVLPQKLSISAHYARTRSMWTDARLIGLTIKHVLLRREFNERDMAKHFTYGGLSTWTK